jgi:hypothetical protein
MFGWLRRLFARRRPASGDEIEDIEAPLADGTGHTSFDLVWDTDERAYCILPLSNWQMTTEAFRQKIRDQLKAKGMALNEEK